MRWSRTPWTSRYAACRPNATALEATFVVAAASTLDIGTVPSVPPSAPPPSAAYGRSRRTGGALRRIRTKVTSQMQVELEVRCAAPLPMRTYRLLISACVGGRGKGARPAPRRLRVHQLGPIPDPKVRFGRGTSSSRGRMIPVASSGGYPSESRLWHRGVGPLRYDVALLFEGVDADMWPLDAARAAVGAGEEVELYDLCVLQPMSRASPGCPIAAADEGAGCGPCGPGIVQKAGDGGERVGIDGERRSLIWRVDALGGSGTGLCWSSAMTDRLSGLIVVCGEGRGCTWRAVFAGV